MTNTRQNIHELKCIKPYFEAVVNNWKRFDYRLNDRDFQYGDFIILKEYDQDTSSYTGKRCWVKILYIMEDCFNMPKNYCIMTIEKVNINVKEIGNEF